METGEAALPSPEWPTSQGFLRRATSGQQPQTCLWLPGPQNLLAPGPCGPCSLLPESSCDALRLKCFCFSLSVLPSLQLEGQQPMLTPDDCDDAEAIAKVSRLCCLATS